MPNWCEGTFKARGKKADLLRFIKKVLEGYKYTVGDDGYEIEVKDLKSVYVPGGNRLFLNLDKRPYIELNKSKLDGDFQFCCPAQKAWAYNSEVLAKLAAENHIDIRVDGYENGLNFEQHIEVTRTGSIRTDSMVSYIDYDWECPMPLLGG